MTDRARSLMTAHRIRAARLGHAARGARPLAAASTTATSRRSASRPRRALEARHGDWVNFLVSRADTGEMLLNLLAPAGTTLQRPADAATIREAARSRGFTVSQIVAGEVLKPAGCSRSACRWCAEDRVELVLSAVVDPAAVGRIVDRQKFPPAMGGGRDRRQLPLRRPPARARLRQRVRQPVAAPGDRVAEKRLDPRRAGRRQRRLPHRPAFVRQPLGGRRCRCRRSIVDTSLRFVWLLCAGFAIAGGLGLWIAWWLASGLSRPIRALGRGGAGARPRDSRSSCPIAGPVDEVRQLVHALDGAAAAIREREERQQAAEQALRAADRAKDEFLAMLGHELRNPLASVANAVAAAASSPPRQPAMRRERRRRSSAARSST